MSRPSPIPHTEPPHDCQLCPRLVALRRALQVEHPDWWNAPIPILGVRDPWLAIIGLAPGKHGANRTGRAFTGDYAGDLLFQTLAKFGLSSGTYQPRPDDGLALNGMVIVNSVRCLPPQNKPTTQEINACRPFLETAIAALPSVRVFVALGRIAHQSAAKSLGGTLSKMPFAHGAEHRLPDGRTLIDSYHCSRYNTNTRRLTTAMFETVFSRAIELRDQMSATSRL